MERVVWSVYKGAFLVEMSVEIEKHFDGLSAVDFLFHEFFDGTCYMVDSVWCTFVGPVDVVSV